ncbi:MAG TPA: asparagine synthase-related protein, partial [Blastocatellia bacterium]|nr:asparagine synthase-related protein [Blastocatellia bacterium]
SFYDDSEPDWNERPYFTVVESTRGVEGIHIETSWLQRTYESPDAPCRIYLCPGADSASIQHEQRMEASIWCAGFRTILSGIGGDEVLGGVPTPLPELAAYLASGQFSRFVRRATEWSLVSRDPLRATIWNTLRYAHRLYWLPTKANRAIPFWFTPRLRRYCCRSTDLAERISGLGRGPVAVHNAQTWSSMLETLPHLAPSLLVRYEYRYPFLDRDLVEFLFGIPREQLVLPGRRRALMRRALRGIVPDPVLERPRKAFLIKGPLLSLQRARAKILGLFQSSLTAGQGFIYDDPFRRAFDEVVRHENAEDLQPVLRTILFELWLRACAIDPTTSPFDTSALRIR